MSYYEDAISTVLTAAAPEFAAYKKLAGWFGKDWQNPLPEVNAIPSQFSLPSNRTRIKNPPTVEQAHALAIDDFTTPTRAHAKRRTRRKRWATTRRATRHRR